MAFFDASLADETSPRSTNREETAGPRERLHANEWGVENISLRASVRRSGVAPLWRMVRHTPLGSLFLALLVPVAAPAWES